MARRQVGEGVDLLQAVPKMGPGGVDPYDYNNALRQRLMPINDIGEQQSAYSAKKRSEREAQAYMQQLQSLRAQQGALGSQGYSTQPIKWDGKKWISPAGKYGYSGTFGHYAKSGGEHNALDFLTPLNSAVYMPFGGKIVSAKYEGPKGPGSKYFGNAIRVQFDNGTYGIFGHLNGFNNLKAGQYINPGSVLGWSGSTGTSTGPHLHYEMRTDLYNPSTAFDYRYLFGW